MSTSGSVSHWIDRVKQGDSCAATNLWRRYSGDLRDRTRRRLNGFSRRVVDEDDLVTVAFNSFFQRARAGQFPDLESRTQFWALLITITDRKVVNIMRQQLSGKRGGGRVVGESAWHADDERDNLLMLAESVEPPPELVVSLTEMIANLDDQWRTMVLLRSQGWTHEEIALELDRSVATVERKLRLLRATWRKELFR